MTTDSLTRTNGLIWHVTVQSLYGIQRLSILLSQHRARHGSCMLTPLCSGLIDFLFSMSHVCLPSYRETLPGNPDLAMQVARRVVDDVSSVELNCGHSKPFSTHSGMGPPIERTQTSISSIITALHAANILHLRLRGREDAPALDATRHARPHRAHRQQGHQLPHDPLPHAHSATCLRATVHSFVASRRSSTSSRISGTTSRLSRTTTAQVSRTRNYRCRFLHYRHCRRGGLTIFLHQPLADLEDLSSYSPPFRACHSLSLPPCCRS
ncbi:hypothetical protein EDB87DRAFT_875250 [Lactarius vividus]|nr:hypothetical protein EDB87DRAFT_875250 [Lactarius vividus]